MNDRYLIFTGTHTSPPEGAESFLVCYEDYRFAELSVELLLRALNQQGRWIQIARLDEENHLVVVAVWEGGLRVPDIQLPAYQPPTGT